jgi:hypothetical protein
MKSQNAINWEAHGHAAVSRGYDGEREIARIVKLENHTHALDVQGQRIGTFRYIKDARKKAAEVYTASP